MRNITRMALQGRPHSTEFVSEYTVSYGYNGLDFADYKEEGGNVKVNTPAEQRKLINTPDPMDVAL